MCSRCKEYEKFIKQADDRGMQELAAFLRREQERFINDVVEADEHD